MKKLFAFLPVVVGGLWVAGCESETYEDTTVVTGDIALTRVSGAESGETGFTFPDRTRINQGGFDGYCAVHSGEQGQTIDLFIQRTQPDQFGLASFELEMPFASELPPGSAQVTAEAAGTTYEDTTGSCSASWNGLNEITRVFDFNLDCAALTGADPSQTVGLTASLWVDCD